MWKVAHSDQRFSAAQRKRKKSNCVYLELLHRRRNKTVGVYFINIRLGVNSESGRSHTVSTLEHTPILPRRRESSKEWYSLREEDEQNKQKWKSISHTVVSGGDIT